MLTISAIWTLCVLQIKSAFVGNETWKLVSNTPDATLKKSLEKIEVGDIDDDESDETNFLYKFTLSLLISFLVFVLEICLCAYLMIENSSRASFYLAFAILYKDLILFAIFSTWNTQNKEMTLFETLNIIPKWARRLERLSALISAVILFFLAWGRI